ncbi:MAG: hypothetical protein K8R40_12870 [Anaerolineaceae bacterium]|nr:hypothetical protein [Anaerolineaceae bacterium]
MKHQLVITYFATYQILIQALVMTKSIHEFGGSLPSPPRRLIPPSV